MTEIQADQQTHEQQTSNESFKNYNSKKQFAMILQTQGARYRIQNIDQQIFMKKKILCCFRNKDNVAQSTSHDENNQFDIYFLDCGNKFLIYNRKFADIFDSHNSDQNSNSIQTYIAHQRLSQKNEFNLCCVSEHQFISFFSVKKMLHCFHYIANNDSYKQLQEYKLSQNYSFACYIRGNLLVALSKNGFIELFTVTPGREKVKSVLKKQINEKQFLQINEIFNSQYDQYKIQSNIFLGLQYYNENSVFICRNVIFKHKKNASIINLIEFRQLEFTVEKQGQQKQEDNNQEEETYYQVRGFTCDQQVYYYKIQSDSSQAIFKEMKNFTILRSSKGDSSENDLRIAIQGQSHQSIIIFQAVIQLNNMQPQELKIAGTISNEVNDKEINNQEIQKNSANFFLDAERHLILKIEDMRITILLLLDNNNVEIQEEITTNYRKDQIIQIIKQGPNSNQFMIFLRKNSQSQLLKIIKQNIQFKDNEDNIEENDNSQLLQSDVTDNNTTADSSTWSSFIQRKSQKKQKQKENQDTLTKRQNKKDKESSEDNKEEKSVEKEEESKKQREKAKYSSSDNEDNDSGNDKQAKTKLEKTEKQNEESQNKQQSDNNKESEQSDNCPQTKSPLSAKQNKLNTITLQGIILKVVSPQQKLKILYQRDDKEQINNMVKWFNINPRQICIALWEISPKSSDDILNYLLKIESFEYIQHELKGILVKRQLERNCLLQCYEKLLTMLFQIQDKLQHQDISLQNELFSDQQKSIQQLNPERFLKKIVSYYNKIRKIIVLYCSQMNEKLLYHNLKINVFPLTLNQVMIQLIRQNNYDQFISFVSYYICDFLQDYWNQIFQLINKLQPKNISDIQQIEFLLPLYIQANNIQSEKQAIGEGVQQQQQLQQQFISNQLTDSQSLKLSQMLWEQESTSYKQFFLEKYDKELILINIEQSKQDEIIRQREQLIKQQKDYQDGDEEEKQGSIDLEIENSQLNDVLQKDLEDEIKIKNDQEQNLNKKEQQLTVQNCSNKCWLIVEQILNQSNPDFIQKKRLEINNEKTFITLSLIITTYEGNVQTALNLIQIALSRRGFSENDELQQFYLRLQLYKILLYHNGKVSIEFDQFNRLTQIEILHTLFKENANNLQSFLERQISQAFKLDTLKKKGSKETEKIESLHYNKGLYKFEQQLPFQLFDQISQYVKKNMCSPQFFQEIICFLAYQLIDFQIIMTEQLLSQDKKAANQTNQKQSKTQQQSQQKSVQDDKQQKVKIEFNNSTDSAQVLYTTKLLTSISNVLDECVKGILEEQFSFEHWELLEKMHNMLLKSNSYQLVALGQKKYLQLSLLQLSHLAQIFFNFNINYSLSYFKKFLYSSEGLIAKNEEINCGSDFVQAQNNNNAKKEGLDLIQILIDNFLLNRIKEKLIILEIKEGYQNYEDEIDSSKLNQITLNLENNKQLWPVIEYIRLRLLSPILTEKDVLAVFIRKMIEACKFQMVKDLIQDKIQDLNNIGSGSAGSSKNSANNNKMNYEEFEGIVIDLIGNCYSKQSKFSQVSEYLRKCFDLIPTKTEKRKKVLALYKAANYLDAFQYNFQLWELSKIDKYKVLNDLLNRKKQKKKEKPVQKDEKFSGFSQELRKSSKDLNPLSNNINDDKNARRSSLVDDNSKEKQEQIDQNIQLQAEGQADDMQNLDDDFNDISFYKLYKYFFFYEHPDLKKIQYEEQFLEFLLQLGLRLLNNVKNYERIKQIIEMLKENHSSKNVAEICFSLMQNQEFSNVMKDNERKLYIENAILETQCVGTLPKLLNLIYPSVEQDIQQSGNQQQQQQGQIQQAKKKQKGAYNLLYNIIGRGTNILNTASIASVFGGNFDDDSKLTILDTSLLEGFDKEESDGEDIDNPNNNKKILAAHRKRIAATLQALYEDKRSQFIAGNNNNNNISSSLSLFLRLMLSVDPQKAFYVAALGPQQKFDISIIDQLIVELMGTHMFKKTRLNLLFLKLVYARCLQQLQSLQLVDAPFEITLHFFNYEVDFLPDILKEHVQLVRAKMDRTELERKLLEKYYNSWMLLKNITFYEAQVGQHNIVRFLFDKTQRNNVVANIIQDAGSLQIFDQNPEILNMEEDFSVKEILISSIISAARKQVILPMVSNSDNDAGQQNPASGSSLECVQLAKKYYRLLRDEPPEDQIQMLLLCLKKCFDRIESLKAFQSVLNVFLVEAKVLDIIINKVAMQYLKSFNNIISQFDLKVVIKFEDLLVLKFQTQCQQTTPTSLTPQDDNKQQQQLQQQQQQQCTRDTIQQEITINNNFTFNDQAKQLGENDSKIEEEKYEQKLKQHEEKKRTKKHKHSSKGQEKQVVKNFLSIRQKLKSSLQEYNVFVTAKVLNYFLGQQGKYGLISERVYALFIEKIVEGLVERYDKKLKVSKIESTQSYEKIEALIMNLSIQILYEDVILKYADFGGIIEETISIETLKLYQFILDKSFQQIKQLQNKVIIYTKFNSTKFQKMIIDLEQTSFQHFVQLYQQTQYKQQEVLFDENDIDQPSGTQENAYQQQQQQNEYQYIQEAQYQPDNYNQSIQDQDEDQQQQEYQQI